MNWLANTGFYISDSVIYITSSDPSDIYLITALKSTSTNKATFTVINYSGDTNQIDIQEIDKTLGIFEWVIHRNTGVQKFLMQNSDYSKKLKMIVCDCGDRKCLMEFKVD